VHDQASTDARCLENVPGLFLGRAASRRLEYRAEEQENDGSGAANPSQAFHGAKSPFPVPVSRPALPSDQ